nr:uncharacterized protein LOC123759605 isoform X4 [Procambarus clarkii]
MFGHTSEVDSMSENTGQQEPPEAEFDLDPKGQQAEDKAPPQASFFHECVYVFTSTWKSFSYDHHETLRSIRQESVHCAASFLLWCAFCLACAVSLGVTERSYMEDPTRPQPLDPLDVNNQILLKEEQTIEDLWSASSLLQEQDWKAKAQETLKKVREECASLQGCARPPEDDIPDWGIMNSFVYMLTVTTSIGYGHIFPRTNAGRALTIVYAILGIPIFLILMADFGKLFTRLLKSLFVFVRRLYRTSTCRRVRKSRAVQSVKQQQQRVSPTPKPPLAVPESISTDFDKQDGEVDQLSQVREREPFLSEEKRKQEQNGSGGKEEEEQEEQEEPRPCCCSAWMRKARVWCGSLCRRKEDVAVEDATPESEEEAVIDDNFNLPISLALLILLAYMVIGCVIYTMWESWTYFEAFYFIFISMTTIGFGDYVPQVDDDSKHPAFMMMTTVYLVFGLALTAMCINIIQEKLSDTFRHASEKLKDSLGHIMAAATQGEEGALQEGKEVEVAEVHGGNIQTPTITVKKET